MTSLILNYPCPQAMVFPAEITLPLKKMLKAGPVHCHEQIVLHEQTSLYPGITLVHTHVVLTS